MSATDSTNGHGYIVTGMDKVGDRRMQVHLLLPSGKRCSVVLDVWHLAADQLARAADAFEHDTRQYPPTYRGRNPAGSSG